MKHGTMLLSLALEMCKINWNALHMFVVFLKLKYLLGKVMFFFMVFSMIYNGKFQILIGSSKFKRILIEDVYFFLMRHANITIYISS